MELEGRTIALTTSKAYGFGSNLYNLLGLGRSSWYADAFVDAFNESAVVAVAASVSATVILELQGKVLVHTPSFFSGYWLPLDEAVGAVVQLRQHDRYLVLGDAQLLVKDRAGQP